MKIIKIYTYIGGRLWNLVSTLTGGSSSDSGYITSDSSGNHLAAVIGSSNIYISTNGIYITTIYIDNILTINNNNIRR